MARFDPITNQWVEDENEQITGLQGIGGAAQPTPAPMNYGTYRGKEIAPQSDPEFAARIAQLGGKQSALLDAIRQRADETQAQSLAAINGAGALATAGGIQKNALPNAAPYVKAYGDRASSYDDADKLQYTSNETQDQKIAKYIREAYEDEVKQDDTDYARNWAQKEFDYTAGQDSFKNNLLTKQDARAEADQRRTRYQRLNDMVTQDGRPVFYDTDSSGTPRVVDSTGAEVKDLRKLSSSAGAANRFQSVKGANGDLLTFDPATGTYKSAGINVGKTAAADADKGAKAQDAYNALESLKNHPGMGAVVGSPYDVSNWGGMIGDKLSGGAGTAQADFRSRAATAQGLLKLAQSGTLKGTLSNSDMQMLGEAVGNLQNFNISEDEYQRNIQVAQNILKRSIPNGGASGTPAAPNKGWGKATRVN